MFQSSASASNERLIADAVLSEYHAGAGAKVAGSVHEHALFACEVIKTNERGVEQVRVLLLSSDALYNFKPSSYSTAQRVIPLPSLAGLVISSGSLQIVVRVRSNYDYLVRTATVRLRDEFIQLCMTRYAECTGCDLTIHEIGDADLTRYVVTESNLRFKKGLERHFTRMYEERQKILQSLRAAPPARGSLAPTAYAFDHLDLGHKKRVLKLLQEHDPDATLVLFSDAVFKYNMSGQIQTRHFVVTSSGLFNFQPSEYERAKRFISFHKLTDVLAARQSFEVVLQLAGEHDYRFTFESKERRDQFIRVVCEQYKKVMRHRVAFESLDLVSLEDHACTTDMLPLKLLMEHEMKAALDIITSEIQVALGQEVPVAPSPAIVSAAAIVMSEHAAAAVEITNGNADADVDADADANDANASLDADEEAALAELAAAEDAASAAAAAAETKRVTAERAADAARAAKLALHEQEQADAYRRAQEQQSSLELEARQAAERARQQEAQKEREALQEQVRLQQQQADREREEETLRQSTAIAAAAVEELALTRAAEDRKRALLDAKRVRSEAEAKARVDETARQQAVHEAAQRQETISAATATTTTTTTTATTAAASTVPAPAFKSDDDELALLEAEAEAAAAAAAAAAAKARLAKVRLSKSNISIDIALPAIADAVPALASPSPPVVSECESSAVAPATAAATLSSPSSKVSDDVLKSFAAAAARRSKLFGPGKK